MTAKILLNMLKENTGASLLDSGGVPVYDSEGNYVGTENGYGRNHEINKARDFENEPATTLNVGNYGIEVMHNVYHFLLEHLEYDANLNSLFYGPFLEECDSNDSKNWLELMEEFPKWLENVMGYEIEGIFGGRNPVTENTYNHENLLSQTLQFTLFSWMGDCYTALQIHGGCDVRGGYTKPKLFKLTNEYGLLNYAQATIVCEDDEDHLWTTDDCNRWYYDSCSGYEAGKRLEEYDLKDLEEEGAKWEKDKLCFLNGVGFCPHCGGKLKASL